MSKRPGTRRTRAQGKGVGDPRLRVVFLPWFADNPYQRQLRSALHSLDLGLSVAGHRRPWHYLPRAVLGRRPDILHLHWLNVFSQSNTVAKSLLKLMLFMAALVRLRLSDTGIVWTVHNLESHESLYPSLDRLCTRLVVKMAHALIVHGEAAAEELRERFELRPSQIVAIVPHGNYRDCYPNEIGCAEARDKLGLKSSDFVFLFFGMIRPYKGVTELVTAFRQLSAPDCQLVIAGRPLSQKIETEVRVLIGDSDRIHFNPAFVPDAEVQTFINSCDVVVFPYRNILTSGAVVLAMSFGRACLAPKLGTLTDVLDERGAILYEPGRPNALAESMILALERRDSLTEMGRHNQRKATTWRWRRVGSETAEVYRRICNR